MEVYPISIVCVILFCYMNYSIEQNIPNVPCPSMFSYHQDGSETYGIARIRASPLGQTTTTEITMSLAAQLFSQYVGSLELYGTREAADQEIQSNQPVTYKVLFPLTYPLPKLTQISVNGQVLCSGPPEIAPYVTTIRLERVLYTVFTGVQQTLNPSDYNPNYQNPINLYYNNYNQQPNYVQPYQIPLEPYRMQPQPNQIQLEPYRMQSQLIQIQPEYTSTSRPPQELFSQYDSEICGMARYSAIQLLVGGEETKPRAWPWLVAVNVQLATGVTYMCGGNLVSKSVVVSAAHCFNTPNGIVYGASDLVLFLGRYNRLNPETESKVVYVQQLYVHYDYKTKDQLSFDADVAVLIMTEKVQFSDFIRPICLSERSSNDNLVGEMGIVVGWGYDASGKPTSTPEKIDIPIVSESLCLRSNAVFREITSDRTFCAGNRDGRGPCYGDSGSGMVINRNGRWMLIGIVSAGIKDDGSSSPCSNLSNYIVLTNVGKFIDWIKYYTQNF